MQLPINYQLLKIWTVERHTILQGYLQSRFPSFSEGCSYGNEGFWPWHMAP